MISKNLLLLIILVSFALIAGCTQTSPVTNTSSPLSPSSVATTVVNESSHPETISHVTPAPQENQTPITSVPTLGTPLPTPEPTTLPAPVQTQDPDVEFRDRTLLALDNMNSAKEGLLLTYKSGDMDRVKAKAEELTNLIRKNDEVTDMPAKMDYVRLNYYGYIDQVSQFAETFTEGSTRWLASDKSSANSFFDAGIMASDRADISDKRIRKFFDEHVLPVQINLTK